MPAGRLSVTLWSLVFMLPFLSYMLIYSFPHEPAQLICEQHSYVFQCFLVLFSVWPPAILTAHHLNLALNQNDSFLCAFHAKILISGVRFGAINLTLGVGNSA